MRRHVTDSPSKQWAGGRLTPRRMLAAGMALAPAAWVAAGCSSSGGDLISTVALPSMQSVEAGPAGGLDMSASAGADRMAAPANVTPAQRGYLDALAAAGVRPSNELHALSIGTYVCQARTAGQSDQAIWDAVAPMVRSDLTEANGNPPDVAYLDVNPVIGNYIGIATQRLC